MTELIKINAALITAVFMWSSAFVAIRLSLEGYSAGALALFRFALASLFLLAPWWWFRKNRLNLKQIIILFIIGSFGTATYSVLLNLGEKSVSPGIASFIVAQTPIMNSLLAIFFLKERPSWTSIGAIAISGFGIAIIAFGQDFSSNIDIGLVFIIGATLCGCLQTILQKYLLVSMSALELCAYSTWFATLALLPFAPSLLADLKTAPLFATFGAIFLAIFPTVLGQWLWAYGLSKTLVIRASSYLYLLPFLSTVLSFYAFGFWPASTELLGGMIALIGVALVKRKEPKLRAWERA